MREKIACNERRCVTKVDNYVTTVRGSCRVHFRYGAFLKQQESRDRWWMKALRMVPLLALSWKNIGQLRCEKETHATQPCFYKISRPFKLVFSFVRDLSFWPLQFQLLLARTECPGNRLIHSLQLTLRISNGPSSRRWVMDLGKGEENSCGWCGGYGSMEPQMTQLCIFLKSPAVLPSPSSNQKHTTCSVSVKKTVRNTKTCPTIPWRDNFPLFLIATIWSLWPRYVSLFVQWQIFMLLGLWGSQLRQFDDSCWLI